ncbi:U3 small nucleolar RNA-associated protein 25 [Porphyridium purpureum]|uniref:U3 small nucleolar RNA-associated protein 25 n=1 Tax=Porphyridium purpureum TaxID=35688 RepID=A0A5J4YZS1_PORPP|nr:U3 small nucleolar RNA-associated protein 25 [Porphyridium purpureum]|eukprot:POR8126..scf208_2
MGYVKRKAGAKSRNTKKARHAKQTLVKHAVERERMDPFMSKDLLASGHDKRFRSEASDEEIEAEDGVEQYEEDGDRPVQTGASAVRNLLAVLPTPQGIDSSRETDEEGSAYSGGESDVGKDIRQNGTELNCAEEEASTDDDVNDFTAEGETEDGANYDCLLEASVPEDDADHQNTGQNEPSWVEVATLSSLRSDPESVTVNVYSKDGRANRENEARQERTDTAFLSTGCTSSRLLYMPQNISRRWARLEWTPKRLRSLISRLFATAIGTYRDTFCIYPMERDDLCTVRQLCAGHILSHLERSLVRTKRNSAKLKQALDEARLLEEKKNNSVSFSHGEHIEHVEEDDGALKDQGFTRPRVLFLTSMRNNAYDLVNAFISLCYPDPDLAEKRVRNISRFRGEFLEGGHDVVPRSDGDDSLAEHEYRFRGNIDDDFKLGIAYSHSGVKLFADFYESDCIVASPLGLVRLFESAGSKGAIHGKATKLQEKGGAVTESSKSISDFLSSIEVCIVDDTETLLMQNWEYVLTVFERMNKIPHRSREQTDYSRVREYFLNGQASLHCQTILLASYESALLSSLMRNISQNHMGALRIVQQVHATMGSVNNVLLRVPQSFLRVPRAEDRLTASTARFEYFTKQLLQRVGSMPRTLVFVPSYFDFVRIRNYLARLRKDGYLSTIHKDFTYACLSEYANRPDMDRARSRFLSGRLSMLIYTERAHFFYRFVIRGANHVFFYGLPDNARFYSELVNMLQPNGATQGHISSVLDRTGSNGQSVTCLFDAFDTYALRRVVGADAAKRMTSPHAKPNFIIK